MKHTRLLSALFATSALAGLAACNRPEVVAVPVPAPAPAPVVVPGPPGPQGPAGSQGTSGEPGKNADSSTVVIVPVPAASAPSR